MVNEGEVPSEIVVRHDLSQKVSKFLDPHLAKLMLEWSRQTNVYSNESLKKEELRVLELCGLWKQYIDLYPKVNNGAEAPEEYHEKLRVYEEHLGEHSGGTDTILEKLFADEKDVEMFKTIKDSNEVYNWLLKDKGFDKSMLDTILTTSMLKVQGGCYSDAAEYLDLFLSMCPRAENNTLSALWGKLCCEIVSKQWEDAHEDIERIKEKLSQTAFTSHEEMTQKSWLMHWTLFVYFAPCAEGKEDGMAKHFMDLLISGESYWNAMRNYCSHLYRYLIASAMIAPNTKHKKVEWLIEVTANIKYSFMDEKLGRLDPIVDFCVALLRENNFGRAKKALIVCERVLEADMFLSSYTRTFLDQARDLLYDRICRTQARLSIPDIAQEIGKSVEETEKWIVEIIRPLDMEAKVDSEKGEISLEPRQIAPYTQLIGKTKTVALETQRIIADLRGRRGVKL